MSKIDKNQPKDRNYVTYQKIERHTTTDANGKTHTEEAEQTITRAKVVEPDYIKIYTKMWCEFNEIPEQFHQLFLSLAVRMSYANIDDTANCGGQIVHTGMPDRIAIMRECGWKSRSMYQRGLKALVDAGAIRKINNGAYQVNPLYAGRGTWLYNPKEHHGGVKELIANFDFAKKNVQTSITWIDSDDDTANTAMHQLYGIKNDDEELRNNKNINLIVKEENSCSDDEDKSDKKEEE